MPRSQVESGAYELVRRARRERELLQHGDKPGLDGLMNEYLALADELEPETRSARMPVAQAGNDEESPPSSRAA